MAHIMTSIIQPQYSTHIDLTFSYFVLVIEVDSKHDLHHNGMHPFSEHHSFEAEYHSFDTDRCAKSLLCIGAPNYGLSNVPI